MILVTGGSGVLGSALVAKLGERAHAPMRAELNLLQQWHPVQHYNGAFLCAGTKGYKECEGNTEAFAADVDGNIRLIRTLRKTGTFIVFISTDAVDWAANTAYARNRLLVEQALWLEPNCAVVRPRKFDVNTAPELADFCINVFTGSMEGVHTWTPSKKTA